MSPPQAVSAIGPVSRLESARQVDAWLAQAWEIRHEDTRAALAVNQRAYELALATDYARGVAYGLLRTGLCLLVLADDDDACLAQLEQAAALMRSLQDRRGECEALNLQGSLHSRRNDYLRAIELGSACLALRRELGDREGEAAALNNLSLDLRYTHRYAQALEHLFESLELAEAESDDRGCAYALGNIAGLLIEIGDEQAAVGYAQRSLACLAGTRDRARECSTRIDLGRALAVLGQETPARDQLHCAVALARGTGNRSDLVGALLALGRVEQGFGRLDEARNRLQEALLQCPPAGDRLAESEILCLLGQNAVAQGDAAQGLQRLQAALDAALLSGSELRAAEAHRLLAQLHEERGDPVAALAHFRRFHECERRVQGRETARSVRRVLAQAVLKPVQREADSHRNRARELAAELDAERQTGRAQQDLVAQLSQHALLLEKLAREDGLTGVANRRWLDLHLERECERARRFRHPLSVAMIDVDNFKAVNDRHSHAVGDAVLRRLAQLLRSACRVTDELGRYGGEEFMVVLAETSVDNAAVLCEKLRSRVEAEDWRQVHPALDGVTVSIGLAGVAGVAGDTLAVSADLAAAGPVAAELCAAADRGLYQAKLQGKNRVCR